MRGFTLVEILIVISIMALLAVGSFVYFKDFSARQYTNKAVGEIQSLLRLAQSNATSSTRCPIPGVTDQGATAWSLVFTYDSPNINLNCNTSTTVNYTYRSYTLENAKISGIASTSSCSSSNVTLTYSSGAGTLSFSNGIDAYCIRSAQSLTFTIANTLSPGANTKTVTISKGGAVNVE